ncbi:MAG: hypothetical protein A2295_01360 [Candidatus Jacksonbacteria bacterium RIFOXYB2_FULL_44_15]|nr:MAG: hypothetical protein A2240_03620 [Candidatus Jacksonbacteria bacterium RIFOXYA2_FULL_43_12]OGY76582.1 MAG: hypothetical protein A2295_01360 [Candidatus Jacksonbacteria bacterium RIFOXYB2_FULL_44_15]
MEDDDQKNQIKLEDFALVEELATLAITNKDELIGGYHNFFSSHDSDETKERELNNIIERKKERLGNFKPDQRQYQEIINGIRIAELLLKVLQTYKKNLAHRLERHLEERKPAARLNCNYATETAAQLEATGWRENQSFHPDSLTEWNEACKTLDIFQDKYQVCLVKEETEDKAGENLITIYLKEKK